MGKDTMQFDLKIIQPYRGIFLFAIGLPLLSYSSLVINQYVSNTILSIFFILILSASTIGIILYLTYGRLLICIENEELNIKWIKRLPLDFNSIKTIRLDDIIKIRIDRPASNSQIAIKIYFSCAGASNKNHSLFFNSYDTKFLRSDMIHLTNYLAETSKAKQIKIIDHWDEWHEKNYLKIAYKINLLNLLIALYLLSYSVLTDSFKSKNLLLLLFFLPQLYLYSMIMKRKIKPEK